MADKKITELTALTSLSNDDLLVVVDDPAGTAVTKKITASNLKSGLIADSIIDAKGDLIVGTAADTPARLAVGGTDGHVLMVDAVSAAGVKWAAVPASPPDSDQAVIAASVFA
jgi:hypothetical protein